MMRYLRSLKRSFMVSALLLLGGCAPFFRPPPFGRLQVVLRGEQFAPSNSSEDLTLVRRRQTVPYTANMPILKGDTLRTGPTSRALVLFRDGYQMFVGPNSQMVVENPSVFMSRGAAYVATTRPRPRRRFTGRTGYTRILPRGTEFFFTAGPGGSTVAVTSGSVHASWPTDTTDAVVILEMEQTTFLADSLGAGLPRVTGLQPAVRDSIRLVVFDTVVVRTVDTVVVLGPSTRVDTLVLTPDSVLVPSLVDASIETVLARLNAVELRLAAPADAQAGGVLRWRAVRQVPEAGSKVAVGTPVTVDFAREVGQDTGSTPRSGNLELAGEAALVERLRSSFEPGRSTIEAHDDATLATLAELLQRYPTAVLEVVGHADSTGPEAYNLALSRARAEGARRHLVDRYGIALERIITSGQGETRPEASNATATGRARNRRVEFRLVVPAQ
jgi:outer membrane protein OmpA-like peptidoglycan-associated protein